MLVSMVTANSLILLLLIIRSSVSILNIVCLLKLKLYATEIHASTDSKLDVIKTSMGNKLSWLAPQKENGLILRWLCQTGGGGGEQYQLLFLILHTT